VGTVWYFDICNVYVYVCNVCIYAMCNDQIRVISISITSNICHFLLGTFQVPYSSYFKIYSKLVLSIVTLCVIEH
jgi:hypothetical protein